MKSKLIAASGSLLMGAGLFYLALKSDPTVSADTMSLDPMAFSRFQIVIAAATLLVIVSFILFAWAALSAKDRY